jgi:hypothetical protein
MSLEEKARKLAEQKKVEKAVDWAAERDWWLEQLRKLYAQLDEWLRPLKQEGTVAIKFTPKRLSEEQIGAYAVEAMVLDFSGEGVVFDPQGTLILGARGRVDVYRRGRAAQPVMFILSGDKNTPTWEIWPSRDPRQRQTLTDASFKSLLESLL